MPPKNPRISMEQAMNMNRTGRRRLAKENGIEKIPSNVNVKIIKENKK